MTPRLERHGERQVVHGLCELELECVPSVHIFLRIRAGVKGAPPAAMGGASAPQHASATNYTNVPETIRGRTLQ